MFADFNSQDLGFVGFNGRQRSGGTLVRRHFSLFNESVYFNTVNGFVN